MLLDDVVFKVVSKRDTLIEERLALWIRPRPAWCPTWLWGRLLSLVLVRTESRCRSGQS